LHQVFLSMQHIESKSSTVFATMSPRIENSMDLMLDSTSASTSTSTSSSSLLNNGSDSLLFSAFRETFLKKNVESKESGNCSSKAMRTMARRPINMFQTLLIPGGSGGISAAYCNEETLSTSFLVLDGFLTIFLGQFSLNEKNIYNMERDANERWTKRVETNVCIGKVSYEYRMAEKEEKSMSMKHSSKSASIVSQTLVKKPLGVGPEPNDSKSINTDNYIPPSHKMVADCLTFHEFDEAVNVFEDILQIDEERYGENDLVCAVDLHNLGVTNLLAGKLNEAMNYFEESVLRKRECLGLNDNSISDSLVEIGIILYYKGDMDGALAKFKDALGITSQRSSRGDIGRICNNIACVYLSMNEPDSLDSAILYLEKALENQKVGMGSDTQAESALLNVAITQSNIGHLKLRLNELDDAIAPLEESLLVLESVLGDDNMTVESVRANIAIAKKGIET